MRNGVAAGCGGSLDELISPCKGLLIVLLSLVLILVFIVVEDGRHGREIVGIFWSSSGGGQKSGLLVGMRRVFFLLKLGRNRVLGRHSK